MNIRIRTEIEISKLESILEVLSYLAGRREFGGNASIEDEITCKAQRDSWRSGRSCGIENNLSRSISGF
jgi:hypothetical protein